MWTQQWAHCSVCARTNVGNPLTTEPTQTERLCSNCLPIAVTPPPLPPFAGISCVDDGDRSANVTDCLRWAGPVPPQIRECRVPCKDDCNLTAWSRFTECSGCGGSRIRKRSLTGKDAHWQRERRCSIESLLSRWPMWWCVSGLKLAACNPLFKCTPQNLNSDAGVADQAWCYLSSWIFDRLCQGACGKRALTPSITLLECVETVAAQLNRLVPNVLLTKICWNVNRRSTSSVWSFE